MQPFAVLHKHGLGDMIYYIKGTLSVGIMPKVFIVTQKHVAKFLTEYYSNIEIIYVADDMLRLAINIARYRPYISHRISTRFSKLISPLSALGFIRSSKLTIRNRKEARFQNLIVEPGHLARRGLHHAISAKEINLEYVQKIEKYSKIAKPKDAILIHPGCGKNQAFKRWPTERYFELIEYIEKIDVHIYLTFGDDEIELAGEYQEKYRFNNKITILKNPNFLDLSELIRDVKVVLGSDNGIAHLASLSGTATIVLAGPSNIKKTKPVNENLIIIKANNQPMCAPCITKNYATGCSNAVCMTSITVPNVIQGLITIQKSE